MRFAAYALAAVAALGWGTATAAADEGRQGTTVVKPAVYSSADDVRVEPVHYGYRYYGRYGSYGYPRSYGYARSYSYYTPRYSYGYPGYGYYPSYGYYPRYGYSRYGYYGRPGVSFSFRF